MKYFVMEKMIFKIKYPSISFGLEEQNGGIMTKNRCHAMAIVIRIFPNWLGNP